MEIGTTVLTKQGIIEDYDYWVSYNYDYSQPRTHYLQGWLTALEGKSEQAIQIWKDGLQLVQTMGVPYEEARLHDILSRHLPSEEHETQIHRDTARQLFENLNTQLDLKKE